MDLFNTKRVAELERRNRALEDDNLLLVSQLSSMAANVSQVFNTTGAWEKRFFDQKRLYEELVFSMKKLVQDGLAGIVNGEKK